MDKYCKSCETYFEDVLDGKCTKCGSLNTVFRDCFNCANSGITDDKLYCVIKSTNVSDNDRCDNYNT